MLEPGFEFAPGYILDSCIGRGAFGVVWRITAPGETKLAVKFLDLANGEWEKEYLAIKKVLPVQHPNLMPIYAMWLLGTDGKALLASVSDALDQLRVGPAQAGKTLSWTAQAGKSDWLEKHGGHVKGRWLAISMRLGGMNLLDLLQQCKQEGQVGIPPKKLVSLIEEAAKGLDYLGSAPELKLGDGWLQHSDVKPANIVLIGDAAVVCDFGLAEIWRTNDPTRSSIAGTFAYTSPETIGGKTSRNSDQYSLAITYYQLRTGSLPFSETTFLQTLEVHRTGKLSFEGVTEAEQDVLRRATHLDWQQRFPSSAAMAEALRDALRPAPLVHPVPPSDSSPQWLRRLVLASAAGLAMGAGAAFTAWRFQADPTRPGHDPESISAAISSTSPIPPTQPPLNQEVWSALLETAFIAPESAESDFRSLIGQYPELKRPLPIQLLGHEQDIEQVDWAGAVGRNELTGALGPSILFTRSADPYVIAFKAESLHDAVLPDTQWATGGSLCWMYSQQSDVAITPDARWAACGGVDGRVRVWSPVDSQPATRSKFMMGGAPITAVLWHPSLKYLLAAADDGKIHLAHSVDDWPVGSSPEVASFAVSQAVRRWRFDRAGETLVWLDNEGGLNTLPWKDCERFLLNQTQPVPLQLSVAGAPVTHFVIRDGDADEQVVLAAGSQGELSCYSLADKQPIMRLTTIGRGPMRTLATTGSGTQRIILSGGDEGQFTIKYPEQDKLKVLTGHSGTVRDIAISPDGDWAASVSADGWGTLRRVREAHQVDRFVRFGGQSETGLNVVSWDPSGRWLVTGGTAGQLALWDARHLRLLVLCCPQAQ